MELDKLIGKLIMLALLLHDYDFEVVYFVGISNPDADGLSRNPSPSNEDLTEARWHKDFDQDALPGWHVATYPTLCSGTVVEAPIHGLHDETDRPHFIADI